MGSKIYFGRSTVQFLVQHAYSICMNYITKKFILVSSSDRSKQLSCFVQGQGKERNKKIQQRTHDRQLTVLKSTNLIQNATENKIARNCRLISNPINFYQYSFSLSTKTCQCFEVWLTSYNTEQIRTTVIPPQKKSLSMDIPRLCFCCIVSRKSLNFKRRSSFYGLPDSVVSVIYSQKISLQKLLYKFVKSKINDCLNNNEES